MMWGGNYDAERSAGASTNRTATLSGSYQPRASVSRHPLHAAFNSSDPNRSACCLR
ncbi:BQ5605_C005g03187 [Microbotryum silenes-dioicae]|uniref:BQ5605_C005g03187 protein n=1 Tax=Microbotryum silenes-dioicae TaxID=796604 RepID=A0A2X0PC82_9BASI|nr:BQ5605_C005g03187 [Microbotryum silenes-dioicae]